LLLHEQEGLLLILLMRPANGQERKCQPPTPAPEPPVCSCIQRAAAAAPSSLQQNCAVLLLREVHEEKKCDSEAALNKILRWIGSGPRKYYGG